MSEPRQLRRDTSNAVLGGVLSGIGKYLNADPVVVRVVFVLVAVVTGFFPALIAYVAIWLIVPPEGAAGTPAPAPASATPPAEPPAPPQGGGDTPQQR